MQSGLYSRAVYNAERLIFHDSFFHPQCANESYTFLVHTIKDKENAAAVYIVERFIMQSG